MMTFKTIPAMLCGTALLFLILNFGCQPGNTSIEPDFRSGTYDIHLQSDTAQINGTLEVVQGIDSVLYGHVKIDQEGYWEGGFQVERQDTDSVIVSMLFGTLRLAKSDTLQGTYVKNDEQYKAILQYTSGEVAEELKATVAYPPLKTTDSEPLAGRWPTPIDRTSFYFIDIFRETRQIQKATLRENGWTWTLLKYDPEAYELYSFDLAPDRNYLIAHGNSTADTNTTLGNGDIFKVFLKNDNEVDTIIRLPAPVNSPDLEIFPGIAPDGSIYFSSRNRPDGLDKMDLYRAEPVGNDNDYMVENLGEPVNSDLSEAAPYIHSSGNFMLFYRRTAVGDAPSTDKIFLTKKTERGWSEPELLNAPVNVSYAFEYGARISPDEKYLYLTSGRRGRDYIYRIPIADLPQLKALL